MKSKKKKSTLQKSYQIITRLVVSWTVYVYQHRLGILCDLIVSEEIDEMLMQNDIIATNIRNMLSIDYWCDITHINTEQNEKWELLYVDKSYKLEVELFMKDLEAL